MKPFSSSPALQAEAQRWAWLCVLAAWLLGTQQPDSPETARVKIRGYSFALLAAAPGVFLILASLVRQEVYLYAALYGLVIVGVALMFPLVLLGRISMLLAERCLAILLFMSGGGFLLLCARYPGQIIDFDLLGNILLFVVAGLLLVLPPRMSITLSLCLLVVYRLEVWRLGGQAGSSLLLAQWVNIGMFALLMVGVVMRQTLSQQAERAHLLQELALRDTLTGLLNRRGFESAVAPLRLGSQHGALIVLDIDDFKPINDTYGHAEGDRILERLSAILRRLAAETGGRPYPDRAAVCARWGGEEFLLYLPEADVMLALEFAERLRREIGTHMSSSGDGTSGVVGPDVSDAPFPRTVTISAGVCEWQPGEPLHRAFPRADSALYTAKEAGKDCVRFAPSAPFPPDALLAGVPSGG